MSARLMAIGIGAIAIIATGIYVCFRTLRHRQLTDTGCISQVDQSSRQSEQPLLEELDRKEVAQSQSLNLQDADEAADGSLLNVTDGQPKVSGSKLVLEVIFGPSAGLSISTTAVEAPWPEVTIGRAPHNQLTLDDLEVSSRHAAISWNPQVERWQLVDKGSLNGTFLNGIPVNANPGGTVRTLGRPADLHDGDSFTVGSSSRLRVRISGTSLVPPSAPSAPLIAAVAADAMTARKNAKPLPMEDVSLCEWPLRGLTEFGVFAIFDGHAGRAAAENASRIMPEKLSALLLDKDTRETVLLEGNATSVLREAFHQTEAELPNEDEGCTATVLLVWQDTSNLLVAQAANVGDSHCVFSICGEHFVLTEDHRLTSPAERARLEGCGVGLREGDTRLWGMNIARVLGDKFLKAQGVGLSAEPHISQALQLGTGLDTFAVIASDGLWDVLSPKRVLQLVAEVKAQREQGQSTAHAVAGALLRRARAARTQDNTTVLAVDFEGGAAADSR